MGYPYNSISNCNNLSGAGELIMAAPLPRITVIIPVRNAAATIGKALESVCAQNYPDLELMVLDALSDDGTLEVIKSYESKIAYWRSAADDGANDSYNEGIERATGSVIALLNADDWYEPGILKQVGEAFAADPTVDVVTCEAQVWKEGADGTLQPMKLFTGKSLFLNPQGTPMPNARFWRKHVFDRHGLFMVRNHLGQRMIASDLEFLLRVSQYKLKNHLLLRVGYHYLMHAGSITFGADRMRRRQMYLERAHIAGTYLDSPQLSAYRPRLKRWHRRGSARNFYWQLLEKNYAAARQQARQGLRISGPFWLLEAMRVGLRMGLKRNTA